jgi:hypothetical protein
MKNSTAADNDGKMKEDCNWKEKKLLAPRSLGKGTIAKGNKQKIRQNGFAFA